MTDQITPPAPRYTVERHGSGWAIYLGRDQWHHGANLGQLTECDDKLPSVIEAALNATTTTPAPAGVLVTDTPMEVRDCYVAPAPATHVPHLLQMRVAEQGAVAVNTASVVRVHSDCLLIEVDLRSKYAEVLGMTSGPSDCPMLLLTATERTLHLHAGVSRDSITTIEFPELAGWEVFCASGPGRYTLSIALYRRDDAPVRDVGDIDAVESVTHSAESLKEQKAARPLLTTAWSRPSFYPECDPVFTVHEEQAKEWERDGHQVTRMQPVLLERAPAEAPVAAHRELHSSDMLPRDGLPRFRASEDGRSISDEDFIYDAMLQVGGDFGGDEIRKSYAEWLCSKLNTAPQAPQQAEQPADLMMVVEQILDAGHLNTEDLGRLRAAWNASIPSPGMTDAKDAARYRWLRDRNDWYAEPRLDEKDGTKWELVFYSPQRITDPSDDDNLDAAVDAAIAGDSDTQVTSIQEGGQ